MIFVLARDDRDGTIGVRQRRHVFIASAIELAETISSSVLGFF